MNGFERGKTRGRLEPSGQVRALQRGLFSQGGVMCDGHSRAAVKQKRFQGVGS
jgi:hypothetical protein